MLAFAFEDQSMEHRYQQYFVSSCIDRLGPIMRYVWFPIIAILRLSWIAYWLMYPFQVSPLEWFIVTLLVAILIFGIFVVCNDWNEAIKAKFGVGLHWAARAVALLIGMRQTVARHEDPQSLAGIAAFVCFWGLVIPSFTEYLYTALPLPLIRPLVLHLAGHPADHIRQVFFQNALILALGISITWTMHADCRRDWLRLPAAGATARGRTQRGSEGKAGGSGSEAADWDRLDGYFTDAERAESHEQALQARRRPHWHQTTTSPPPALQQSPRQRHFDPNHLICRTFGACLRQPPASSVL
jgi:hypothetical protein